MKQLIERAKIHARKSGFPEHADDFSQEVALKIHLGRKTNLHNLFVDFLREVYGDSRYQVAHAVAKNITHATPIESYDGESHMPTSLIDYPTYEEKLFIDGLSRRLQLSDRAVFLMYSRWGMTMNEIADVFGVTESLISHKLKEVTTRLGKRFIGGNA